MIQLNLKMRGLDIGDSGINHDGIDSIFGARSNAAFLKVPRAERQAMIDLARKQVAEAKASGFQKETQTATNAAKAPIPLSPPDRTAGGAPAAAPVTPQVAQTAPARAARGSLKPAGAAYPATTDAVANTPAYHDTPTGVKPASLHTAPGWHNFNPNSMLATGGHMDDLQKAWAAHERGPKPGLTYDGKHLSWEQMAQAIHDQSDPVKKLAMANDAINQTMRYGGSYTATEGRPGSNWISTPAQQADFMRTHNPMEHVICGDLAASKMFLLRDAGYPADKLSLVTIAPSANDPNAHVVVGAQTQNGQNYIMELNRKNGGAGYVTAVGDTHADRFGTSNRPITRIFAASGLDASPGGMKLAQTAKPALKGIGLSPLTL
ncbi:MAG: hypothetical protein P4M15_11475 [Alphaproteobacteria bacterium]|nr:hypothetical protein [Alphaproteobacteria bacterium]